MTAHHTELAATSPCKTASFELATVTPSPVVAATSVLGGIIVVPELAGTVASVAVDRSSYGPHRCS